MGNRNLDSVAKTSIDIEDNCWLGTQSHRSGRTEFLIGLGVRKRCNFGAAQSSASSSIAGTHFVIH